MTEHTLQLSNEHVWRALETIDPVAVLAEQLIGRTVAGADYQRRPLGRLTPWPGPDAAELLADPVALERPAGQVMCVASGSCLRMAQAATMAALAARELLVPGGVTVAVLGTTGEVQPQLAVLAKHVPDISHVALWTTSPAGQAELEPKLLDQLQLSGIGLSVAASIVEAVFGANLVVAAGDGWLHDDLARLRSEHIARGAVLVNATGRDLPDALVDGVDRVYVDDLAQLPAHQDRHVVAVHFGRDGDIHDLGQLLTGQNVPHRGAGDVVLVELLGIEELDAELAHCICQAARQRGLGIQILTDGE